MEQATLDAIGKEVHDLVTDMREWKKQVSDGMTSLQSFQKQAEDRFATLQGNITNARKELPTDAPIDAKLAEQSNEGGLFNKGVARLPYKKALRLSANSKALAPRDRETLRLLHDHHDAVMVHYWHNRAKYDHTESVRRLAAHADTLMYAGLLERAGYGKTHEIMNPANSAAGLNNLDYTLLSSTLLDMVRIELSVANQFVAYPLTRHKQDVPTMTGDALATRGTPPGTTGTTPPPTDTITSAWPDQTFFTKPSFGKVSFDAEHCLGYMWWNDDMVEDSIIPWLPIMREEASFMIQRAIDRACLDGDTEGAHMDHHASNAVAAPDFRTAWNGLRLLGSSNTLACGNATYDAADFRAQRRKMGKYGRNPSDVVAIMSLFTWYGLLDEPEVLTIEKFGPQAVVKTGVLAKLDGIDIVPSEWVRLDLNATGTFDNTTTDRTIVAMANRRRFLLGTLGNVEIETTRVAPQLTTIIQADVRADFQPVEAASSGVFAASANVPCVIAVNCSTSA